MAPQMASKGPGDGPGDPRDGLQTLPLILACLGPPNTSLSLKYDLSRTPSQTCLKTVSF